MRISKRLCKLNFCFLDYSVLLYSIYHSRLSICILFLKFVIYSAIKHKQPNTALLKTKRYKKQEGNEILVHQMIKECQIEPPFSAKNTNKKDVVGQFTVKLKVILNIYLLREITSKVQ